jgi:hypothetical protein
MRRILSCVILVFVTLLTGSRFADQALTILQPITNFGVADNLLFCLIPTNIRSTSTSIIQCHRQFLALGSLEVFVHA